MKKAFRKYCIRCEKRLDGASGTYCKDCGNKINRNNLLKRFGIPNYRLVPKYAEKIRDWDRKYQKAKRKNNPGYKAKEYAEYCKKYPEKVKAHRALNRKIRSGEIKRSPCVVCGATYRIEGHHPDYSKPYKVIWLCVLHHKEKHKVEDKN